MNLEIRKNRNNTLLYEGLKLGLILQVCGIGPVCMLVFTLSLSQPVGKMLIGILGLSVVDVIYVSLAVLSISALVKKIQQYQRIFDIVIGSVLIVLGVLFVVKAGTAMVSGNDLINNIIRDFVSKGKALFFFLMGLDLMNPITIVFTMGIFSREMSKRSMNLKETSFFASGFMLATPMFMALVIFIGHFLGVFLSNFIINILNSIVGFFLMYWGIKDIFFKETSKKKDEKIKNITEEIKNITDNELKELFKKNKALLNGHFKLSSGLHSDTYFQSALILQSPKDTARVAKELANRVKEKNIKVDVVISPAMGGIIIGHAVGRSLGVRSIFTERVNGKVSLRRGFSLSESEKVLVVEDVITTGLSIKELMEYVRPTGAEVVAIVSLVDRSAGKVDFDGLPQFSILTLEVKNYTENDCPMCKAGSIAVKPGSRQ